MRRIPMTVKCADHRKILLCAQVGNQCILLRHITDPVFDGFIGDGVGVLSEQFDLASIRFQKSKQGFDQSGFASAIDAQQGDNVAHLRLGIDLLQYEFTVKSLAQVS